MKRLIAVIMLAILLTACKAGSLPENTTAPSTAPATTAPMETTVPVETTAPTETTAPMETTAPAETTAPTETTAPPETVPETTEPLPKLSKVEFESVGGIYYTLRETAVWDRSEKTELGTLRRGQSVVITGKGEGWLRIRYQKTTGYIPQSAVTDVRPQEAIDASESCGGIVYPGGEIIIAIDPGHQSKAMKEKEPMGPGSETLKTMVTAGASGVSTRQRESGLNLAVALKLRDELIARGYTVVMTRESNDVTISNAQRAEIANCAKAHAFIRIHANSSHDPEQRGAYTLSQTSKNPYNGHMHEESYRLSNSILNHFLVYTGMQRLPAVKVDDMTGINWAQMPVTIIEMGYLSNAQDDEVMVTAKFKRNAAKGIANGIDAFFEETGQ